MPSCSIHLRSSRCASRMGGERNVRVMWPGSSVNSASLRHTRTTSWARRFCLGPYQAREWIAGPLVFHVRSFHPQSQAAKWWPRFSIDAQLLTLFGDGVPGAIVGLQMNFRNRGYFRQHLFAHLINHLL